MTIRWKQNRETDDTESLLRKARNLLGPANGAEVNVGQNVVMELSAGQAVMEQKTETPMQYQVAEVLTTFDIKDLLPSGKGEPQNPTRALLFDSTLSKDCVQVQIENQQTQEKIPLPESAVSHPNEKQSEVQEEQSKYSLPKKDLWTYNKGLVELEKLKNSHPNSSTKENEVQIVNDGISASKPRSPEEIFINVFLCEVKVRKKESMQNFEKCGFKSNQRKNMIEHLIRGHNLPNKKSFAYETFFTHRKQACPWETKKCVPSCLECKKNFDHWKNLLSHGKSSGCEYNLHQCLTCKIRFYNKKQLLAHDWQGLKAYKPDSLKETHRPKLQQATPQGLENKSDKVKVVIEGGNSKQDNNSLVQVNDKKCVPADLPKESNEQEIQEAKPPMAEPEHAEHSYTRAPRIPRHPAPKHPTCPYCMNVFEEYKDLINHRKICRKDEAKSDVKCSKCSQVFRDREEFYSHKEKCERSKKNISTSLHPSSLKTNLKTTETSETGFCEICNVQVEDKYRDHIEII